VGVQTSEPVTRSAFQSILGRILKRSVGFGASSTASRVQSLGCRGKDALLDLQALTAQERKLIVKSFIFVRDESLVCYIVSLEKGAFLE
jgi:hypothetical protein